MSQLSGYRLDGRMRAEIGISEAARRLNISISTLKRLCDEGLVPNQRTSGGHRRFDQAQIVAAAQRLMGETGRYVSDARSDDLGRLMFMLVAGFEEGILQLLQTLRSQYRSLADVLDECLVPALLDIRAKSVSKDQSRMAESTAQRVLDQLFTPALGSVATPLMVGVSAGSAHSELSSKLVELALWSSGMTARSLGCADSGDQLLDELTELNPSVVWLSILHDEAFSELVTLSQTLRTKLPAETELVIYSGCQSLNASSKWSIEAFFMSLHSLCEHVRSSDKGS